MFNNTNSTPTTSSTQHSGTWTATSASAAYYPYLDESFAINNLPILQQHPQPTPINFAAMLYEQQQRSPSAHSSSSSPMPLHHQQQIQQQYMQPLSSRKLFIGGLGQINDDALRQYYLQWGQVVDCIVIRDPGTRSSRGFGFVTYANAEMADIAMANRPHIINGKAVDAKRAVPREKMNPIIDNDEPPVFLSVEPTMPGCRLQLSNLNWEWHTLDTLRAHFEQYGPVEQLEMFAYPRGYGSLVFENQSSLDCCMANGMVQNVNGHPVELKLLPPDYQQQQPSSQSPQHQQQHSSPHNQSLRNSTGSRPNSSDSASAAEPIPTAAATTTHSIVLSSSITQQLGHQRVTEHQPQYCDREYGPPTREDSNQSSCESAASGTLNLL